MKEIRFSSLFEKVAPLLCQVERERFKKRAIFHPFIKNFRVEIKAAFALAKRDFHPKRAIEDGEKSLLVFMRSYKEIVVKAPRAPRIGTVGLRAVVKTAQLERLTAGDDKIALAIKIVPCNDIDTPIYACGLLTVKEAEGSPLIGNGVAVEPRDPHEKNE